MTFIKQKLFILSAIVVVVVVTVSVTYWYTRPSTATPTFERVEVAGDMVVRDNLADLQKVADLILVVTPTADLAKREAVIKRFDTGDIEEFYTNTEVTVDKVIKGTLASNVIEVSEPYVINDQHQLLCFENYTPMKKNSQYVVFLYRVKEGVYSVANNQLGKFNVDGTDADDLRSGMEGFATKSSLRDEIKKAWNY